GGLLVAGRRMRADPALRLVPAQDALPRDELEVVFRSYARYVAAVGYRLLGRDDEVDDVVQEVFMIAMRGLRKLRDAEAIRGWLATVTVRVARRRLRRRRFRLSAGPDDAPDYQSLVAAAGQHDALLIMRAYRVLEGLAVDDKIAWMLRH